MLQFLRRHVDLLFKAKHVHLFDSNYEIVEAIYFEYRGDGSRRVRFDNVLECECGARRGYDNDKSDMSHLQGGSKSTVPIQSKGRLSEQRSGSY